MNSQIDTLIATARSFLGAKESPKNSNNVIFNTHYYGRAVSGGEFPWCAAFVWDVFRIAGLSALFYGGGKTASCTDILNYARRNSQFVEPKELQRGDVVLYKFATNKNPANHVGIVEDVGGTLKTLEGNTSLTSDDNGGAVMARERTLAWVVGGFRPAYEPGKEDDEDMSLIETIAKSTGLEADEVLARLTTAVKMQKPAMDDEFKGELDAAIAAGITDGKNPGNFATRAQAAVMVYRATKEKED